MLDYLRRRGVAVEDVARATGLEVAALAQPDQRVLEVFERHANAIIDALDQKGGGSEPACRPVAERARERHRADA